MEMKEGESISLSAKAGGARKVYWVLQDGNREEILAVDRFNYTFDAGRVAERQKGHIAFQGGLRIRCENSTHPNCHPRERSGSSVCAGGTQKMEWQG